MILEKTLGRIDDYPTGDRRREKILLDRDRLSKPHQKLRTENGESFAVSLQHGDALESGSVIYADDERVVYIELVPEDALVIVPKDDMQWARAAYNIGNMHHPSFICDGRIITPYDSVLESVIKKLDLAFERKSVPIDGTRAGVSYEQGHSHSHDHDHGHSK